MRDRVRTLSGKTRLAVVVSACWVILAATYLEPWRLTYRVNDFLGLGIAPVAIFWGAWWVIEGFRRDRRGDD